MYFNESKERTVGAILSGGKLIKKTLKSIEQLRRHDSDVHVADQPTKILFVSNSSVMCNVSLEELEEIFFKFDPQCQFVVFPNRLICYVPSSKTWESAAGPRDIEIYDEFVSTQEEEEITKMIESDERLTQMKHRSVLHWGHAFDYSSNSAFTPTVSIPAVVDRLVDRLLEKGLIRERPDQVTANVYEAGQGIPSHFDTHSAFEDPVVSLSLLSDVVMEFKDAANSARIAPILLPSRSLTLIQGDARYRWKHGRIRHTPCRCNFPEFCDWDRDGEMGVPHEETAATSLESSYVADVYEKIAGHFDETRHSTWRGVNRFLATLPRGSLLYDIGCGNGKYLQSQEDGLIKMNLLRAGGRACITVWSLDQGDSEYAKMRGNKETAQGEHRSPLTRLLVHDGREFVQQDVLVPWTISGTHAMEKEKGGEGEVETFLRFYHVFAAGEMERLVESLGGCHVESIDLEQGNWIAVIQKD